MSVDLIFGPVEDCSKNLWDQALILGCLQTIKPNTKKYLLVNYQVELSFLNWQDVHLVKVGWSNVFIYIFREFLFLFFVCWFLFKKLNCMHYIWADVLDWRWWKLPINFCLLFLLNSFIAHKFYIRSFSYNFFYSILNYFLIKKFCKEAYFFPRDTSSHSLFVRHTWFLKVTIEKDLSFLAPHSQEFTWYHEVINKNKNNNIKTLLLCVTKRPNISNLDDFLEKIKDILQSDGKWSIFIVCHCFDKESISLSEKLHKWFINSVLVKVPNVLLTRSLCFHADLIVSTLMHFALSGIHAGKPSIFLDYQNKWNPIFSDLQKSHYLSNNEADFFLQIKKQLSK